MSEPTDPDAPGAAGTSDDALSVVPVDLRDYVDFSRHEARRIRALATERFAVDLWCLEPGQATPVLLLKDQDASYTVVGGRSWFVTDEGEIGLDPMGTLLVPGGVAHGIDNRGADPLIVVATVAPPGPERPARPVADDAAAIRRDDDAPNVLVRAWRTVLGVGPDRTP